MNCKICNLRKMKLITPVTNFLKMVDVVNLHKDRRATSLECETFYRYGVHSMNQRQNANNPLYPRILSEDIQNHWKHDNSINRTLESDFIGQNRLSNYFDDRIDELDEDVDMEQDSKDHILMKIAKAQSYIFQNKSRVLGMLRAKKNVM